MLKGTSYILNPDVNCCSHVNAYFLKKFNGILCSEKKSILYKAYLNKEKMKDLENQRGINIIGI